MVMARRPKLETKINHERWLVSYADFITLLFAFFVVMYSVSQVSETKYKILTSVLDETFSSTSEISNQEQALSQANTASVGELKALQSELENALAGMVSSGEITFSGNESWVELEVNSNLLFASGRAEPSVEAKNIFSRVADILAPYENAVAVSGHTDDIPIRNEKFQNNWELSAARAVQVVNLLAFDGVSPERLSAIGYGEFRPIADNSTESGRAENRRVVLRVAKGIVEPPKREAETFANAEPAAARENESQVQETGLGAREPSAVDVVEPVRLRDGGLLFSSDPDLPRNNR